MRRVGGFAIIRTRRRLRMTSATLTRALDDAAARYELLPHAHTESALAEADALGVSPDDVAKTIVVKTPDGYVRAVLPASQRIDLRKVRGVVGGSKKKIHLAHEDQLVAAYPEFELGAVPPIGGPLGDRVIVDSRLAERDSIVLEAGTHDESVRLATTDLIRLAKAEVADISEDEK
jgi:Ala-tRNA(Pro) deacylase